MLDRAGDWQRFHQQMLRHIEEYTRPQYENEDNTVDQVGAYCSEDCIRAINRYMARFKRNYRGNREQLRDMLKIAHYAQFAYDKLKDELGENDVY